MLSTPFILAPIRPLKLRIARLEKQPRRLPLRHEDPSNASRMPYVSLELAWDRPPEYANQHEQLLYQVCLT